MTLLFRSTGWISAIIFLGFSVESCGAKEGTAKVPSSDTLPTAIEHEPCDVTSSSTHKFDTNGDGKPDMVRVMSGNRETCRMVDLNHDDKPDSYLYFEAGGTLRRRESDFDRDGRIDEIAYYAGGIIARKDRETNLDGKLDTWDFYEAGKIQRRMRDSDGDGRVDQWWTWANPDRIECAVIAADHNRDGRPDPNNVIDVCAASGNPHQAAPPGAVSTVTTDSGAMLANASPGAPNSSVPNPVTPGSGDAGVSAPAAAGGSRDAAASTPTSAEAGGAQKAVAEPKKEMK